MMGMLRLIVGIIHNYQIRGLSVINLESLGEDLLDFTTVVYVINWLDNNQ